MKRLSLVSAGLTALAAMGAELSPMVPFVIPTDKPSPAEVANIVETLHSHGFDQFLVYPSDGLAYDYLSPEYFAMIRAFLTNAKERGMKVWLYDEFNWPSGTAHGRIPAENEQCMYRELVASTSASGEVKWQIVVSRELNVDNYCLDGNNLEPASVSRFMELTHFAYLRNFPDFFGSTIRGIFTDEPGHWSGAWRMKMPAGTFLRVPYWSGCEDEYARATGGRNFRADCERAHKDGSLANSSIFRVWTDIKSTRYRQTYFDPIAKWCESNSIVSTGHLFAEGAPTTCARVNGLPLHTLRGLGKPGIDLITSNTDRGFEWLTLAMAQSAVHYRKTPGSVELYALGPCDITFATMRKMYWVAALHGIDTYFTSLYHTRAYRFMKKDSWAMFTSPAQPWFDEFGLIHEDAKVAAQWARKPMCCEVALVHPQRALGSCAYVGGKKPNLTGICNELTWNGHPFELIEEDETTDLPIVLDWRDDHLFERRTGTAFGAIGDAVDFVAKRTKRPSKPGHLRRFYADGSWADVDLTSGAIALSTDTPPANSTAQRKRNLEGEWSLSLSAPSRRRLWFWRSRNTGKKAMPWETKATAKETVEVRDQEDNTAIFWVDEPLEDVRFVLRDYPTNTFSLTLDGSPLTFARKPATSLVMTFNEICRETEPMQLKPGKHIVKLAGGEDTKMFLPVAWLVGEFAEIQRGHLKHVPAKASLGSLANGGLKSFSGIATYATDAEFAAGERLRIDAGGAVVRVKFGGRDLGARGWAPFEWEIPSDLAGKRSRLEIAVKTSVRPVFGSEKDPDAKLNHALWVPSASADPSPVGLLKAVIE